jgi:hypothetical protein
MDDIERTPSLLLRAPEAEHPMAAINNFEVSL